MGDFASTVVDSWLGSTPVDITCFLPLCVRSGIWKSEKKHFYIYFCCSYKLESSKQWSRVPTTMKVRQLKIKVKLSTKKNGTTDNRCKMKPTHYSPKSSLFTIPINGHRNETILSYWNCFQHASKINLNRLFSSFGRCILLRLLSCLCRFLFLSLFLLLLLIFTIFHSIHNGFCWKMQHSTTLLSTVLWGTD